MYDSPDIKREKELKDIREVDEILQFDALDAAEKLTGKSLNDEGTAGLGLLLHLMSGDTIRKTMEANNDSHYSIAFDEYINIVLDLGFNEIFSEEFNGSDGKEVYKVFWNNGILLACESYNLDTKYQKVNSASIYFEYKKSENMDSIVHNELNLSGGWNNKTKEIFHNGFSHIEQRMIEEIQEKTGRFPNTEEFQVIRQAENKWITETGFVPIYSGHCDVRIGIRNTMKRLSMLEIMPQWQEFPFLWLLNYTESKECGYGGNWLDYTVAKAEKFPAEVQKAICLAECDKQIQ